MRRRVLRQWPWLLILALAAILNAGINVVLALYLGWVVDQAAASAQDKFGAMILLGLGVMAAGMVIFLFHAYVDATVKNRLLEQTREKLFQDIYSQSMVRFSLVNTAEYLSRMTNDMKLVEENYLAPYLSVIQNIVAILVSVGLFLYYAPMVLLVIIVGIVIIFVIPSLMGSIMQKKQQAFSDQSEVFTNRLKDFFSGFEVIASAGRRREAEREFTGENREFTKKKLSSEKWKAANMTVSQILAVGVQFSVMVACAWYIMQGRMTVGTLLVLVQIMNIFIGPIMGLIAAFPQMKGAKPIIEKIESYIREAEQIELPGFSEGIRLQNIDFSYGEGSQILKEVELSVEKGKKYVLVGPSGCGKTTLLKLLAGYFEDYGGCITVDGRTLEPQDSGRLFSLCALIHQNIFLFDKSIRENICLYRPCDDSELREAVEKSGVAKFLREELNLDSMTGEDGSKLSGGQRQRIAIARALIQKKPLILLDEGTSSLDPQTACEIERDLLENDEITLLTITHHFQRELMEKYDCVVFMKDGRILGAGSYGELLKNNQEFTKFAEQN